MKQDALQMSLLLDYYGELLSQKQRTCFDLYYNQDLSLSELAALIENAREPSGVHPDHGGKTRFTAKCVYS